MQRVPGADAGFRVRGGAKCRGYQGRMQDLELGGAQVAYPGFQRGGCLRLGPIRKVGGGSPLTTGGGGGGGGETVRLRRGGGAGQGPSAPPGSYASETVTIVTKRVLKHFANELYLSFLILFIL